MKQHIIITSSDPTMVYMVKQEMQGRNEHNGASVAPLQISQHCALQYLDTDKKARRDMSKSFWRMDVFISDDGDIEIKRNFGKINKITKASWKHKN